MTDHFKQLCLSLKGSSASYPFDDNACVFKVLDKMFALIPDDQPHLISLKCDPIRAELLRGQFESVTPAYHMNKRHWNTIDTAGDIPPDEVEDLISHSYELVVSKMTRKQQQALQDLD
ncbi:MmcQ/YjbR family DNA-binding protein [Anaerolineales bacterium]